MNRLLKPLSFLLLLLLAAAPAFAQDVTAGATPGVIVLVPHTDDTFGIESVIPDGWTGRGSGLFARANDPDDVALVAQQAAPLNMESLLNALLPQLAMTEAPEPVDTYAGLLDWTLYQVDVDTAATTIKVDLALAEAGGKTYLLLLQTSPEDYDDLHSSVFLPTLDAYGVLAVEVTEEAVPYIVEEVTFTNGDITLAGTLTLPPTSGPHPAVVLVSGSGPQDRDESLGATIAIKPFRLLADGLTRAGLAVLRYDDRGVGGSSGDFASATTADFAEDAEAALDYLLSRDNIDSEQLGLLGHSEGGLVAAMLGARNQDLDFIIALAGPGVHGLDVVLLQNQRVLEIEGATQEEVDAQVAFLQEIATVLDDPEAIEALTYEHTLALTETFTEEELQAIGNEPEQYARMVAAQSAQDYSAGWFGSFLRYDPAPDWAQTTVPVLAIFGGKDVQVDAEQNAPALEAALEQAGNPDYEIVVLPDANHLFQAADTGAFSEYATLPNEFTPDLLPTILEWLETHVTTAQ